MTEQIDINKLQTAAHKLGLEVEPNSSNSGFSVAGKTYSWEELTENINKQFRHDKPISPDTRLNIYCIRGGRPVLIAHTVVELFTAKKARKYLYKDREEFDTLRQAVYDSFREAANSNTAVHKGIYDVVCLLSKLDIYLTKATATYLLQLRHYDIIKTDRLLKDIVPLLVESKINNDYFGYLLVDKT